MFVCFSVADDNFTAKNASFDEDLTIGVVKCWFNQNKRFHVACDVTRPSTWLREVLSSVAIISHLGVLSVLTQQTELGQSNTHMNYVYVVFKCQEQDT